MPNCLLNLSSQIERIGTARYLIYLGFILIPLGNLVDLFAWNRDPSPPSLYMRPSYPVGGALGIIGIVLVFVGPWVSKGRFMQRLSVFGMTCAIFFLFMIPMTILLVLTGVPFQD